MLFLFKEYILEFSLCCSFSFYMHWLVVSRLTVTDLKIISMLASSDRAKSQDYPTCKVPWLFSLLSGARKVQGRTFEQRQVTVLFAVWNGSIAGYYYYYFLKIIPLWPHFTSFSEWFWKCQIPAARSESLSCNNYSLKARRLLYWVYGSFKIAIIDYVILMYYFIL